MKNFFINYRCILLLYQYIKLQILIHHTLIDVKSKNCHSLILRINRAFSFLHFLTYDELKI
jgi:hypothetical protein